MKKFLALSIMSVCLAQAVDNTTPNLTTEPSNPPVTTPAKDTKLPAEQKATFKRIIAGAKLAGAAVGVGLITWAGVVCVKVGFLWKQKEGAENELSLLGDKVHIDTSKSNMNRTALSAVGIGATAYTAYRLLKSMPRNARTLISGK